MVSSSVDGDNDFDFEETDFRRESDEDTEDASEAEIEKKDEEFTGIKDQMFHDQLQQYKRQLHQLKNGSLPLYVKKLKKLEQLHLERLQMNELLTDIQLKLIEEEYEKEKLNVIQEFEERKLELRDSLINELEHKKKLIDIERQSMELTGDTMSIKPVTTRKLRRRPNDPMPIPEKRPKPSPVQLSGNLDEDEVNEDLSQLCKLNNNNTNNSNKSFNINSNASSSLPTPTTHQQSLDNLQHHDVLVDDGRICIDKKWFAKDQPVSVESKEHGRYNANIISINTDEVTIKRVSDNVKVKLSISNIQDGLCSLKKRT